MTAPPIGLAVKSVRDPVMRDDGERILVDRLWPRGVSKKRAHLTDWRKGLAPSTELRRWFGHDPERWAGFRTRYRQELRDRGEAETTLGDLAERARHHRVTLLFGAGDREHNDAVALVGFIGRLRPGA